MIQMNFHSILKNIMLIFSMINFILISLWFSFLSLIILDGDVKINDNCLERCHIVTILFENIIMILIMLVAVNGLIRI